MRKVFLIISILIFSSLSFAQIKKNSIFQKSMDSFKQYSEEVTKQMNNSNLTGVGLGTELGYTIGQKALTQFVDESDKARILTGQFQEECSELERVIAANQGKSIDEIKKAISISPSARFYGVIRDDLSSNRYKTHKNKLNSIETFLTQPKKFLQVCRIFSAAKAAELADSAVEMDKKRNNIFKEDLSNTLGSFTCSDTLGNFEFNVNFTKVIQLENLGYTCKDFNSNTVFQASPCAGHTVGNNDDSTSSSNMCANLSKNSFQQGSSSTLLSVLDSAVFVSFKDHRFKIFEFKDKYCSECLEPAFRQVAGDNANYSREVRSKKSLILDEIKKRRLESLGSAFDDIIEIDDDVKSFYPSYQGKSVVEQCLEPSKLVDHLNGSCRSKQLTNAKKMVSDWLKKFNKQGTGILSRDLELLISSRKDEVLTISEKSMGHYINPDEQLPSCNVDRSQVMQESRDNLLLLDSYQIDAKETIEFMRSVMLQVTPELEEQAKESGLSPLQLMIQIYSKNRFEGIMMNKRQLANNIMRLANKIPRLRMFIRDWDVYDKRKSTLLNSEEIINDILSDSISPERMKILQEDIQVYSESRCRMFKRKLTDTLCNTEKDLEINDLSGEDMNIAQELISDMVDNPDKKVSTKDYVGLMAGYCEIQTSFTNKNKKAPLIRDYEVLRLNAYNKSQNANLQKYKNEHAENSTELMASKLMAIEGLENFAPHAHEALTSNKCNNPMDDLAQEILGSTYEAENGSVSSKAIEERIKKQNSGSHQSFGGRGSAAARFEGFLSATSSSSGREPVARIEPMNKSGFTPSLIENLQPIAPKDIRLPGVGTNLVDPEEQLAAKIASRSTASAPQTESPINSAGERTQTSRSIASLMQNQNEVMNPLQFKKSDMFDQYQPTIAEIRNNDREKRKAISDIKDRVKEDSELSSLISDKELAQLSEGDLKSLLQRIDSAKSKTKSESELRAEIKKEIEAELNVQKKNPVAQQSPQEVSDLRREMERMRQEMAKMQRTYRQTAPAEYQRNSAPAALNTNVNQSYDNFQSRQDYAPTEGAKGIIVDRQNSRMAASIGKLPADQRPINIVALNSDVSPSVYIKADESQRKDLVQNNLSSYLSKLEANLAEERFILGRDGKVQSLVMSIEGDQKVIVSVNELDSSLKKRVTSSYQKIKKERKRVLELEKNILDLQKQYEFVESQVEQVRFANFLEKFNSALSK